MAPVNNEDDGEILHPGRPASRAKVYCGRCNTRIYGRALECCEILLHGGCFVNHRQKDHRAE